MSAGSDTPGRYLTSGWVSKRSSLWVSRPPTAFSAHTSARKRIELGGKEGGYGSLSTLAPLMRAQMVSTARSGSTAVSGLPNTPDGFGFCFAPEPRRLASAGSAVSVVVGSASSGT